MKTIMQPIKAIAMHDTKGAIKPMRIKYNQQGEDIAIMWTRCEASKNS